MKDAKPAIVAGELAKSADPAVSEWGNPVMRDHDYPKPLWFRGVSRGTEISKYPEEKKS